jgi:TRAP-type C4-dicarboxylate transport system permease small subunit
MNRWAGRLAAAVDWASRAGSFLSGLAILVITVMITYGVTMRYFFGRPQPFVDEQVTFLLVVVIFWGLAHTFRSDGHITVDLLTGRLRPGPRTALRVATLFLGLAFLAIVTWETWDTALRAYRFGRVSIVMLYPLWIPQLCIPLGLGVMFFAMLAALIREVRLLAGAVPSDRSAD